MKKILFAGLGLLAAVVAMGTAIAADIAVAPKSQRVARKPAPETKTASNWSGGQLGGSNGGSSVNNNFVEPGAFNFNGCAPAVCRETPFAFRGNHLTYTAGGFLGYRAQLGSMVLGVEGDAYWKSRSDSKFQNTPPPWLATESFSGTMKQGFDGSLRVRVGMLTSSWFGKGKAPLAIGKGPPFGDAAPFTTLLYVTGGVAFGDVSGSLSYNACSFGGAPICTAGASSWNETRVGWTVGAGVEQVLTGAWKTRLEYRYTDFGSFSETVPLRSTGGCPPTVCGTNALVNMKASNQRLTLGIGYDF